jgi:hypothetical protein
MAIWDKIKKVFVSTAETVQETGKQVVESAQEVGKQVADTSGAVLERAGVDKVGEAVLDSAKSAADKAGQVAERVGGALLDKTNDLLTGAVEGASALKEKSGDMLERAGVDKVGAAILESAQSAQEKAADVAGKVGAGILTGASAVSKTLGEAAQQAGNRMANFVEEAQQAAARESQEPVQPAPNTQPELNQPTTIEVTGSVISTVSTPQDDVQVVEAEEVEPTGEATDVKGAEDFFNRAERWAKGDYT